MHDLVSIWESRSSLRSIYWANSMHWPWAQNPNASQSWLLYPSIYKNEKADMSIHPVQKITHGDSHLWLLFLGNQDQDNYESPFRVNWRTFYTHEVYTLSVGRQLGINYCFIKLHQTTFVSKCTSSWRNTSILNIQYLDWRLAMYFLNKMGPGK